MRRCVNRIDRRLRRAVAVMVAATAMIGFTATAANAGPVGPIVTYTDPTISSPTDIATGPDGALWFTNTAPNGSGSIGRITVSGSVTNFHDPAIIKPVSIVAGPDGAMWFADTGNNSIDRITTAGVLKVYTDPNIVLPYHIINGPDGALWSVENFGTIARISTSGVVTRFPNAHSQPGGDLTTGPDGAVWFTGAGVIGRITKAGTVTTFSGPAIHSPVDIVTGPDGALWFTDYPASIGRITTAGVSTSFSGPAIDRPAAIITGPDGALWFTNQIGHYELGRLTTTGQSTAYKGGDVGPRGLAAGFDGGIWVTGETSNSIGRSPVKVAPHVSVVDPAAGPIAGGTTVTITGWGFTGATQVLFGSVPAPSFTVISDNSITAVVPTQPAAVHSVRVLAPNGSSPQVPGDLYSYGKPAVTAVSPASGPTAGQTSVTITGTGFTTATSVLFGAVPAASFTVTSDTSIVAVAPPEAPSVRSIRVVNPGGTSRQVPADLFTYGVAAVTSISPSSGPTAGGTTVTISGTDFTSAVQVVFGSVPAVGFTIVSDTTITAISPVQGAGPRSVRVTNGGGLSAQTDGDVFTYH